MSLESEARRQLGHGYYNIPVGTGERSTLQIGGKRAQHLVTEMEQRGITISEGARDMMFNPAFTTLRRPTFIELIKLDIGVLGLSGDPVVGWTIGQILRRARRCRVEDMVLGPCPAEVGPHQRLKDMYQPATRSITGTDWQGSPYIYFYDSYFIAHPGIADHNGNPRLFTLTALDRSGNTGLVDSGAGSEERYDPGIEFVFALRDPEPVKSWHPRPVRSLRPDPTKPVHIEINVW